MAESAAVNNVQDDLQKLAQYFKDRYESVENAKKQFDAGVEFNHFTFVNALKKWKVNISDAAELFEFIDVDMSGQINLEELFDAVQQPVEEIKRKEKNRQDSEVYRIYEELAERIRERFGSIEEMFKRQDFLLHDEEGESISLAGFRRLVKQLGVDLAASQLNRAFNSIDANNTGKVSKDELQDALSENLVRGYLVDLAHFMTMKYDSVAKTFEHDGEASAAAAARRASVPTISSSDTRESLPPGSGPMSNEKFVGLLRRLKVLEHVTEETAHFLLSMLKIRSAEDFKAKLENVYKQDQENKQIKRERKEKLERESKRKLQEAVQEDQRVAANDVNDWLKEVEARHAVRAEDVTSKWDVAARSGNSRMQLQDYVTALEQKLRDREKDLNDLRGEVDLLRGEMPSDLSPTESFPSMSPTTRPHGRTAQEFLDRTLREKAEARKAEKIIQAAASGDVAGLQRLLHQTKDVNAVGWAGVTPLMAAARHGRPTVLRYLCERRADLTRTDTYGRTALDHAARSAIARDWLRGQGALTGSEIKAEADMLAQRMLDMQAEWAKLEEYRNRLPSRDLIRRTTGLRRMKSSGTPRSSPDSPFRTPRDDNISFQMQDTPSFAISAFAPILKGPVPRIDSLRPPII
mmetsp:Transcript_73799/g.130911  ORF Transcript_73799/g.130911 Transcript_73799/m.130911 type:complete len:635 (-) Transcript_73799:31-1935(-)